MTVLRQEPDDRVTCGWVERGEVHIANVPESVLEPVSSLGADESDWLRAYRDGATVMAYFRAHDRSERS